MPKVHHAAIALSLLPMFQASQTLAVPNTWLHDPSPMSPFGSPNPKQTDPEARIFDRMIGVHDCKQTRTDFATKKVSKAEGTWVWSYNMNGYGIRDDYRFNPGAPVSQRIYNPETKNWHVWYFLGQSFHYSAEWIGGQQNEKILFWKDGEKLGNLDAKSRLEFSNISSRGFHWKSSVIADETGEEFIDWTIKCRKRI